MGPDGVYVNIEKKLNGEVAELLSKICNIIKIASGLQDWYSIAKVGTR